MTLINKNNHKLSLEAMLLTLVLFVSPDTILFGTNQHFAFRLVSRIVGLLAVVILTMLFLSKRKKSNINAPTIVLVLMLFLFSFSSVINKNPLDGTISRLISLLCGFAIAICVDIKVFASVFKKFVYAICVFAIITEIIAYTFPSFFTFLPVVTNTSGLKFYSYFFGAIGFDNLNQTFKRSMGIFWEPGAFSIYIVVALVFEFFAKSVNKKRLIVDIIALILTFSTTGYISFFCLLFAYFISGPKGVSSTTKMFSGLLLVSLITTFVLFDGPLEELLFGKITSGSSSAATRFSSFFNGLRLSVQDPLFGLGINSSVAMESLINSGSVEFVNGGYEITNTFVGYMVYYGIPFASFLFIGSYFFFRNVSNKRIAVALLFFTLMLCYFGERFYSFFPFVFMFYGFKYPRRNVRTISYENNCRTKYI